MKKFLPAPEQAKRLIIIGGILILSTHLLREGIADIVGGLGVVLIMVGILNGGIAEMLGVGKKIPDGQEPRHPPSPADRSSND